VPFAYGLIEAVEAIMQACDLCCQGRKAAQQVGEGDAVEVGGPRRKGEELLRRAIEDSPVQGRHISMSIIGGRCGTASELFAEMFGMLHRYDQGIIVLCKRLDRGTSSLQ
jgi:hypothetical protein